MEDRIVVLQEAILDCEVFFGSVSLECRTIWTLRVYELAAFQSPFTVALRTPRGPQRGEVTSLGGRQEQFRMIVWLSRWQFRMIAAVLIQECQYSKPGVGVSEVVFATVILQWL